MAVVLLMPNGISFIWDFVRTADAPGNLLPRRVAVAI
jgi:hypothetical protein